LHSGKIMLYTLLLLLLMLYIFACIGVQIITMGSDVQDEEYQDIVHTFFRSVPITMLTLIQFVCLDSIGSIYKPLIEKSPLFMVPYFVMLILVVGIVLMNLVTAVIVNGALEQAAEDKDMQLMQKKVEKQKLVKHLRQIFARLDEDGSGSLSLQEILNMPAEDLKDINSALPWEIDANELFDMLEPDDGGEIHIDDFLEGLYKLSLSDTPFYITRLKKQLESNRRTIEDNRHRMHQLGNTQEAIVTALADLHHNRRTIEDNRHRMDQLGKTQEAIVTALADLRSMVQPIAEQAAGSGVVQATVLPKAVQHARPMPEPSPWDLECYEPSSAELAALAARGNALRCCFP